MGRLLRIPMTREERALARFRQEEDAFRIVLDVLVQWRRDDLFLKVFGVYRSRLRHMRLLAGSLLGEAKQSHAADELRWFARRRDP
jgi:hypothetical protein